MTPRFLMVASFAALTAALTASCAMLPKEKAQAVAAATPVACGARDIDVYFAEQSTELSTEAKSVIDAMASGLNGCHIDHVRIIGAAAEDELVNEEISHERTRVMKDYLVDKVGWSRDEMELLARGERGAVTSDGLVTPMRRKARIIVSASPS